MDEKKKKFLDEAITKDIESDQLSEVVVADGNPIEQTAWGDNINAYANTLAITSLDETGIISSPTVSQRAIGSFFGFRYPHTTIPIEQELEIERIVDRRMAENTPMFEKVMDSMISRKLQSLNILEPSFQQYGLGTPWTITPQFETSIIEKIILESFAQIPYVKNVSYVQHDDKCRLIVIHDNQDQKEAFNKIDEKIIELEETLPKLDIEPWILHVSEVESHHLTNAKTILEKKSN